MLGLKTVNRVTPSHMYFASRAVIMPAESRLPCCHPCIRRPPLWCFLENNKIPSRSFLHPSPLSNFDWCFCLNFFCGYRTGLIMSLEEVQTNYGQSVSDAHLDSNIELLGYQDGDNALQSPSVTAAGLTKISTSPARERLYIRVWTRIRSPFVDWWMTEVLAIFWSLGAFCSLVFILLKYDDQVLSTLSHNIPLNFVVSTLATMSKSSLLLIVASTFGQFKWLWMISSKQGRLQDLQDFDEASRGPLGAAKLLTSRKALWVKYLKTKVWENILADSISKDLGHQ